MIRIQVPWTHTGPMLATLLMAHLLSSAAMLSLLAMSRELINKSRALLCQSQHTLPMLAISPTANLLSRLAMPYLRDMIRERILTSAALLCRHPSTSTRGKAALQTAQQWERWATISFTEANGARAPPTLLSHGVGLFSDGMSDNYLIAGVGKERCPACSGFQQF